jgi:hypothetical protein
VRAEKANANEPLMTCRKDQAGAKTEEVRYFGRSLGGNLSPWRLRMRETAVTRPDDSRHYLLRNFAR